MTTMTLYPKLEATMIEKGVSRYDVATLLEISKNLVDKRLSGYVKFSPAEEMILSDFLDVPRAELFRKREEGKI